MVARERGEQVVRGERVAAREQRPRVARHGQAGQRAQVAAQQRAAHHLARQAHELVERGGAARRRRPGRPAGAPVLGAQAQRVARVQPLHAAQQRVQARARRARARRRRHALQRERLQRARRLVRPAHTRLALFHAKCLQTIHGTHVERNF